MNVRLHSMSELVALSLLGIGLVLSGCPTISSPNDFGSGWVGTPIERYLAAVDAGSARDPNNVPSREDVLKRGYVLKNGNIAYPFPVNFKRCNIHWEVNPAGIIVGYRYEEVVKDGCNW